MYREPPRSEREEYHYFVSFVGLVDLALWVFSFAKNTDESILFPLRKERSLFTEKGRVVKSNIVFRKRLVYQIDLTTVLKMSVTEFV